MAVATNNTETYRLKQWEGIIHDRQASGQSAKEFCEKAGCHPNKHYYWQRKLWVRHSVDQANAAGGDNPVRMGGM